VSVISIVEYHERVEELFDCLVRLGLCEAELELQGMTPSPDVAFPFRGFSLEWYDADRKERIVRKVPTIVWTDKKEHYDRLGNEWTSLFP
jgi:hypothetical protein